ncbi:hypothetical protein Tco_1206435, partial [Tanacetum coccineum]
YSHGDDEDEPSDDDEDEEVDIEADDEEEEEHPAPADSTDVALPAIDQAPSAEETEPFETDESAATPPPHPAYRVTARISIPAPVPTPVWSDVEVAKTSLYIYSTIITTFPMVITTSPDTFSITTLDTITTTSITTTTSDSLTTTTSIITSACLRLHLLPIHYHYHHPSYSPTPDAPSSGTPPMHLLSTDRRADRPEVTLPTQKRLGIALGPRYEVRESSSTAATRPDRGLRADYGFVATMDREIRRDLERDVRYGITDSWDEIVEAMQDTNEVYTRLDDEQTERQLLAGRFNMLFRERRAHVRTARLMEAEARISVVSDYRATGSRPQEADGDYRVTGSRLHEA